VAESRGLIRRLTPIAAPTLVLTKMFGTLSRSKKTSPRSRFFSEMKYG
jgi:hypothetical protein